MSDFETIARRAAEAAGFEWCGLVAYPFAEVEHFERWIASGYPGEMHYLEARDDAGALKRSRLERALPWARSALVCALNYNPAAPYSTELDSTGLDSTELDSTELAQRGRGWIARYALGGGDYHDELLRRLRAVEAELQAQCGPMQSRCYVDTGPFVERALAQAAGVGWIAKNTCLINQREGSWLFLGVVVTSYEVEALSALPAADRCGSCTRCIDACPTDALIAPYQMDARKCISYLTIEKRGSVDEALRPLMGNHVFGCDICQDVCPWNRKAPVTRVPAFAARAELVAPDLEWLASLSLEQWRALFRGSPVKRTKYQGFMRNVCIAMGNSGEERFLARLQELARSEDEVVAEHARWALARLINQAGHSCPAAS